MSGRTLDYIKTSVLISGFFFSFFTIQTRIILDSKRFKIILNILKIIRGNSAMESWWQITSDGEGILQLINVLVWMIFGKRSNAKKLLISPTTCLYCSDIIFLVGDSIFKKQTPHSIMISHCNAYNAYACYHLCNMKERQFLFDNNFYLNNILQNV